MEFPSAALSSLSALNEVFHGYKDQAWPSMSLTKLTCGSVSVGSREIYRVVWRLLCGAPFYRADPLVPLFDDRHPIVFMDGECALCTRAARTIARLNKAE